MRIIVAAIAGLFALAEVSAEAAPNPVTGNSCTLGAALPSSVGDPICGIASHQSPQRDWRCGCLCSPWMPVR